jgi:hypothetical protein
MSNIHSFTNYDPASNSSLKKAQKRVDKLLSKAAREEQKIEGRKGLIRTLCVLRQTAARDRQSLEFFRRRLSAIKDGSVFELAVNLTRRPEQEWKGLFLDFDARETLAKVFPQLMCELEKTLCTRSEQALRDFEATNKRELSQIAVKEIQAVNATVQLPPPPLPVDFFANGMAAELTRKSIILVPPQQAA